MSDLADAANLAVQQLASGYDALAQLSVDQARQISDDNDEIVNLKSSVADLMRSLADSLNSARIASRLMAAYRGLQKRTDWILAPGTTANSGQSGSTGDSKMTHNPDGSIGIKCIPNGPYYDSLWYLPLAGTHGTKTLPSFPIIPVGYVMSHIAYQFDGTNLPLLNAVETETRIYTGKVKLQCCAQIRQDGTVYYYDPNLATAAKKWAPTPLKATWQAGQWLELDTLYQVSGVEQWVRPIGFALNGKFSTVSMPTIKGVASSEAPWIHHSFQYDSNSHGAPFEGLVTDVEALLI